MMLRVAFQTVGCRLNQAETAELAEACRRAGFAVVEEDCDVAIIHGCAITAAAERDSLRLARAWRRSCPAALVVVAGCAAEKIRLEKREPGHGPVDLWVRQSDKNRLPEIVLQAVGRTPPSGDFGDSSDPAVAGWLKGRRTRALLKIQDGCAFRCAYCIVPRLRSVISSRPLERVVAAVRGLADAGCREIVLTGANLGCYDDAGRRLPDLLQALIALPGDFRIRLSSIESTTVEEQVIDIMQGSARFCRYLHLPLQSGSDTVLQRMGRRYRIDDYRRRVKYACETLPILGLGTDIVVGFPGETAAEFEETVRVVEELPFTNIHVFPFSARPGTAAAAMRDSVPADVKRRRVSVLKRLGEAKLTSFAAAQIGREAVVLVERLQDGEGRGWTDEYLAARVTGCSAAYGKRFVRAPVRRSHRGTVWL